MSQYIVSLPDLVIPNGAAVSNVLHAKGATVGAPAGGGSGAGNTDGFGFRDADNIEILAPAALPETVVVQVDSAEPGSTDNFDTLQQAGVDTTLLAGKAVMIVSPSFKQLQLKAGVNVAGTRTFKVNKRVRI